MLVQTTGINPYLSTVGDVLATGAEAPINGNELAEAKRCQTVEFSVADRLNAFLETLEVGTVFYPIDDHERRHEKVRYGLWAQSPVGEHPNGTPSYVLAPVFAGRRLVIVQPD